MSWHYVGGMTIKNKILRLLASSLFALVSTVNATTGSGLLGVSTTVANSCSIDDGVKIDFGEYDPLAINTSATGDARYVTCNGDTVAWSIYSTQSLDVRVMKQVGTEALRYILTNSADMGFATADTSGSAVGSSTGSAIIKGGIATGQNVVPGPYTHQIALTIVF
ncbi:MAG: spore coat protein U-like protein [Paraglaciecola sp.]|jgi:spore coat protein U-like protein